MDAQHVYGVSGRNQHHAKAVFRGKRIKAFKLLLKQEALFDMVLSLQTLVIEETSTRYI